MNKLEISTGVVSCLLRQQFPELAQLPVIPMEVDGWDNNSFRIGAAFTARLRSADGSFDTAAA